MNPDFARAARHAQAMSREMSGKAFEARLRSVGKAAAPLVDRAVASTPARNGSLADLSMSGWRRGKPIPIRGRFTVRRDGVVSVHAGRGTGPLRVLEDGRRASAVGEGRLRFVMTKTKGLRTRHRVVKRASGATEGKGTWTRATSSMGRVMARKMTAEQAKAIKRVWG